MESGTLKLKELGDNTSNHIRKIMTHTLSFAKFTIFSKYEETKFWQEK